MRKSQYCLMHDPERAEETAKGRQLGGMRRRKERAVQRAYNIDGLTNVGQVQRLLEIAAMDALFMENSLNRSRTLAYVGQVALKGLEAGDIVERLRALEAALNPPIPNEARDRQAVSVKQPL